MATYSQRMRRGLPRTPGGQPWPEGDGVGAPIAPPAATETADTVHSTPAASETSAPSVPAPSATAPAATAPASAAASIDAAGDTIASEVSLRRGLPRVAGGDPWPPASTIALTRSAVSAGLAAAGPIPDASKATAESVPSVQSETVSTPSVPSKGVSDSHVPAAPVYAGETVTSEVSLRRGLPRVVGGDPWPLAATVTLTRSVAAAPSSTSATQPAAEPALQEVAQPADAALAASQRMVKEGAPADLSAPVVTAPVTESAPEIASEPATQSAPTSTAASATVTSATVTSATATSATATQVKKAAAEPKLIGSKTIAQWAKFLGLWGGGAIAAAGIIVLAARGVTTLPGVPEFMQRYPGEYALPAFVDPGFPAWARWSHFLNFFFMVLIIRSGLLVRRQQKPDAYFTPKQGGKKISIYLWLHTSIDLLWLTNGIIFVVLLFVSGHWARIVPTSWEVIPNALSAALQYLTLEWPHEDGWVNYNSLQQLMYFTVVFIAAPLAALTGVRMSEWWPEKADRLNKLYPAPVARAVHYPVMLFFVLFILVHVFLVFATGALKNLNHMFAGTPEVSWVGFWWFAAGLLVTAAVTWAARPLVIAPIANLFGRVSER